MRTILNLNLFSLLIAVGLFLQPICVTAQQPVFDLVTASESEILNYLDASPRTRTAPAEWEKLSFDLVTRLAEIGSASSLSFLESVEGQKPIQLKEIMGCRSAMMVPVYDVSLESRKAQHRILTREAAATVRAKVSGRDFSFLDQVGEKSDFDPFVLGIKTTIGDWSASDRETTLNRFAQPATSPWASGKSAIVLELLIADQRIPSESQTGALHTNQALELLRRIDEYPETERKNVIRRVYQNHEEAASAAGIMLQEGVSAYDEALVLEMLNEYQDSAAYRLGQDRSPEMTSYLVDALDELVSNEQTTRYAILALMLQDTSESRDALQGLLSNEKIPEPIRIDVEGWL